MIKNTTSIKVKKLLLCMICFCASTIAFCQGKYEKQIDSLLYKMTLEEKVGQMAQITLDVVGKGKNRFTSYEPFELDTSKLRRVLVDYKIGSVINTSNNRARTREQWYNIISQIQDISTTKTRLGIPVIYGIDAIHGTTYTAGATMFPQQIGEAATFNRDLVKTAASITAYETRASSIPWNFSPLLDLGADPRSPRVWETFGEDPYLITELGKQMVKGYEGDNNRISDPQKVAACLKHFLGYQVPLSGKDRTPSYISEQALREYHLPSFKAGIDAGAMTLMVSSGIINGIPVHADYKILTELLKNELKFQGLVVSDWQDIENLCHRDHIAKDDKEAIMIAINAGIDMSMLAYNYELFCDNLIALVKEGKVRQSRIDDAVRRILRVKYALDLFNQPTTNYKNYPEFGSKNFENVSYKLASESITLLKNKDNILPLDKTKRVLVAGPNANSMRTLNGAWTYSWQGEKVEEFASAYSTIFKALENKIGKENVTYMPGVSYNMNGKYYEEYEDNLNATLEAAKQVDAVILCVGENTYTETPGNLNDLYLSDLQTELAQKITAIGKPVILILNEGRPRCISKIEQQIPAIVQTYLPGNFGGVALADILFGDVNPSGKLPYTYPRYPNAIITYYHKPSEERTPVEGAYNYDADYNPQFKFGDGLSYTAFKYDSLQLSTHKLKTGEKLTITINVTNTGKREGKEAVQLFISDLVASITPDVKRLRGFEKINLQPGETKKVAFIITADDIGFVNVFNKKVTESGEFKVSIKDKSERFDFEN
jgi:beta-glucosidase